ncbi:MAG: hypothetical protein WC943_08250, partial [Elusimicrobiota bacterium]
FHAIEGTLSLGTCLLDKDRCCMGSCALGDMLSSINDAVASRMQTRLSELVRTPAVPGRAPRFRKG